MSQIRLSGPTKFLLPSLRQSTPAIVPPLRTPLPVLSASKTSCTLLRFLLDFSLFCFTCPTLLQTFASPEQVMIVILPLWWSPPLVTPSRQSLPRPLPVSPRVQLLPAPPSVAAASEFGWTSLVLPPSLSNNLGSNCSRVGMYPSIPRYSPIVAPLLPPWTVWE